jgi:hypothetical protein
MTTKIIPESKEVICDICQKTCNNDFNNPARRRQEGQLILKRHALDMYGDPAADGTVKFDTCDSCLNLIEDAVNAVTLKIRGKA